MGQRPTIKLGWVDERRPRAVGRSVWHTTAFWIWLSLGMFWLATYEYFSYASARDPTSYFFDKAQGYQRMYSKQREKQAYAYIESVNHTGIPPPSSSETPSMCLGVATIARPSTEQYVRGTVGSLLEGLSDSERAEIYLIIFIAHTDPAVHPIYNEPWARAVANKVLTYEVSEADLAQLHLFEDEHLPRNKSMYDYGYLLSSCSDTQARWIAIVEDDNIARAGWYRTARSSLQEIQGQMSAAKWLYLRMFFTETLLGWNSEEWPRYLGWSLLLFISLLYVLVGLRSRSVVLRWHLSNSEIVATCGTFLPAFIGLYFMAGRVTVQPQPPGVGLMPRFGCCSQGLIFPVEVVPSLIERIRQAMHEDYYIDMLFERFADTNHLARFAQFPSLLQHVGSKSSKGFGFDTSAATLWNFGFETIQPR
ncbi:uncharacterized protein KY384_001857 [Bacidia gigantensis]|uniref:uncharacterized protein n=1 Tax=Bacidia gigantensis TaxID=2732470 RepID=UPI001D03EA2F|nr:uncharacterized protein KY384_001857 [Bacidia gigantensis]KAG8533074.1 hypothetical protein KY384_001857 [Bacidia gigantensis]